MKKILFTLVFCFSTLFSQEPTLIFEKSEITWTAYKFTRKVGVSGSFNEVVVSASAETQVEDVLNNLSFNIQTQSVDSKNEVRDARIYNAFFKKMKQGDNIYGEIHQVGYGQAIVEMTLNGISKSVPLAYTVEGLNVTMNLTIDLGDFKGGQAIQSLNKQCDGLHKGKDGISILWPTVDVVIKASLTTQN